MRCFLICTSNNEFWPVEELVTEGDVGQSIDAHCQVHGEEHREHIRLFFPEMPTDVLSERDLHELNELADANSPLAYRRDAAEILDLYDNTIH